MINTLMYDANKPTGATSYPGFRRKGQRRLSHGAQVIDTSYLTHRRLGPGLQECTEGGRSPRPAIDEFPRAAQALTSGVHPVSPGSDHLGFSRAKGRDGGGKVHPGVHPAHSLGASSRHAERGFTFLSTLRLLMLILLPPLAHLHPSLDDSPRCLLPQLQQQLPPNGAPA